MVALGFVSIEIVQNHVDLLIRIFGDDRVHEIEELDPTPSLVVTGLHLSCGNIQRGEQCGPAMAFVFMGKSRDRLAVGQLQPALSANSESVLMRHERRRWS